MRYRRNHERGANVLAGIALGFLAGAAAMYAFNRTPTPIIGSEPTRTFIPVSSQVPQAAPLLKRVPETSGVDNQASAETQVPKQAEITKPRGSKKTVSSPININTASQAELELLPEVGPSLAKAILAYREAHGPFTKIEELDRVKGIGPKVLAKISPMVTVSSELP